MRNLVAEILQKHLPLNGVKTTIEQTLTSQHGVHAEGKRADLVVKAADGYIRYIDFAVAEPSSACYMERGSLVEDKDGMRASDQRADEKMRLFKRDMTAIDAALFVPFVIDYTLRIGIFIKV